MKNKQMATVIRDHLKEDGIRIPVKYINHIMDIHGYLTRQLLIDTGRARLYDLGYLYTTDVEQKVYDTPITGGPVTVPAKKRLHYRPSSNIKRLINEF